MFEGLVRQLLLGYLGRYIKDFQKEQLKITLWNEEVLLENVELILEAFDYLQLPVALKRGRIGRLSIRIPWKKLGWDPIIILLEDVFFCASQREDHEWSTDAVERRELAAKKAKLAAAELAKLSRRVCDNQAGQSFISHVTGRILDSIQVSMRNVRVVYCEMQYHPMFFGLRFSSLTITKQNPTGPSSWKARGGQVNKIVEIRGLGIYCSFSSASGDLICNDAPEGSEFWPSAVTEEDSYDFLLTPFDVSFLVMKTGKLEQDTPQYSVSAQLTKLTMSINPTQLQHILAFQEYISTCLLRERYGRYRPWGTPLSKKLKGWQKVWWHYAQESVLSDVRKKLKKTSWRYLSQRLAYRRKYVNLYKIKLGFLQKEQTVGEDVLLELEQMEKESEIDDILGFRSIAEQELEKSVSNSTSNVTMESANVAGDKLQNDEPSSNGARGWLNWLSRGVLGAGGTDDSNHFSGVVSDEVIKDICEATKFQPMMTSLNDNIRSSITFLLAVNFSINQISLSMQSIGLGQEIAQLHLDAVHIQCKVWEDSSAITAEVGSAEVISLSKEIVVLRIERLIHEKNATDNEQSSASIQVNVSTQKQKGEILVKVLLQPLEVYCDLEFLSNLIEFFSILEPLKLQQERVLQSLNGIEDVKSRLLSKAECILSSRQKLIWDVNFVNVSVHVPWSNGYSKACTMVMQARSGRLLSRSEMSSTPSEIEGQYQTMKDSLASGLSSHLLNGLLIDDLYDHFEISINDFQTSLMMPSCPEGIALVEKVCASISLAFCIIPDEMILKQLEACIIMSSLRLHFSASIYAAICRLIEHLQLLSYKFEQASAVTPGSTRIMPTGQALEFCFSIATKLKLVELEVNLEDDGDNSSILLLSLQQLEMQYTRGEDEDCWVRLQSLKILSYTLGNECDGNILFSTTPPSAGGVSDQHEISNHANDSDEQNPSLNGCFLMHYESHKKGRMIYHTCSMRLKNAELHCYPNVVKLLVRFCSRLAACHKSHDDESSSFPEPCCSADFPGFRLQRFGQSNFYKDEYSKWESIPLDHFPFVTVHNCGSLCSLEGSLISPDWRKSYNLRDKIFSSSKDYNILPTPLLMFSFDEVGCHSVEGRNNITFLEIDLNVAHIMVHFHDSSCIVGSISLPVGKASVISHADCLDVLSSTEGLTFTSQWWASNCQEFLWGPLLPTQSPILNIRVRKRSTLPLRSCLEISFGIQHACCTLPPEYLAILIGYFNLPDWSSNESEHQLMKNLEHMDTQNDGIIVYKFEILDCSVISPVEGNNRWLLKLHSEQLCGSFIQNDVPENALNGVLSECLIPVINIADTTNSLNIFGRDVSLSLLLVEESGCGSFNFNQETAPENCSLIQSLSIDIWLRMPGQNESSVMSTSTYIMAKISSCDIVAEDSYCVVGLQALMDVIDHYSLVEMESRCYTCDVLQFFESKRSPKDRVVVPPDVIGTTLIEMKCYTDMLSVQLMRSERGLKSANMIARIDLGFVLSMFLENETISSLDVCFSSLVLTSLIHSFLLAKCSSSSSVSPVLDIHLSAVDKSQFKLSFSLSSLETWLYINDWVMVIDLLNYYVKQLSQDSGPGESASNSLLENILTQTSPDSESTLACPDSDNPNLSSFSFNMKSENIGISCHIPLWFGEEVSAELSESKIEASVDAYSSNPISCGKDCKFITVELNSRGTELSVSGDSVKFASKFNKTTGLVRLCESGVVHSWPFFQLCHLHVHLDVCDSREALMDIKANIQVEGFDIWLSDQVFYFWHGVEFEDSEANSFELTFGNVDLNIQLRKISILLIDGRWSCNGPLLEFVMRNVLVETSITESSIHSSVAVDLLINYNNIHKVLWEPFMETWKFQINIIRKCDNSALLDRAIMTDVHLKSTAPLNINLTAAVIEVVLKAIEMLKEAWGFVQLKDVPRNQRLQNYQCVENLYVRRYASYIVHNMTSLPFVFHVYQGLAIAENLDELAPTHEDTVPPGSSVPIYIDVPLEEQLFNYRPAQSADGLGKRQSNGAGHHFMTIQFEGISDRSEPISMDLVGLSYFEVNFSKDDYRADTSNEFLVPVVFDVSLQRYSKLIQLYSTVILMNSTSVPLEIRFDIPFGISSKVVDPVYPGQEFPLPLHLAEAGQIRWRPLGSTYLWSEAHNLSNILSMGNRSGFLRSLVCYPSHPSSNLFRCCLLVQDIGLSLSGRPRKGSTCTSTSLNSYSVKTRFIHHVTFCTPLVLKNYLPQAVSVTIESGGVSCTATLVEVETSFFHMDSSHDLDVTFCVSGFRPSTTKFPRAESFIATAKSSETLFSLTETIAFGSYQSAGSISVMVEKVMDALSGAREICISVPFLLYNCTGFSLTVSRFDHEEQGNCCTIPSCYNSREQGLFIGEKAGLGLVSSEGGLSPKILNIGGQLSKLSVTNNNLGFRNQTDFEVSNFCDNQWLKAKPFMYSPDPSTPSSEISVRVSRFLPECTMENWLSSSWSSPFFLVAPSGSATVFVPQPSTSSAAIISVSSSILDGPLSGKTRAITFHPKYVISNACSKDLCYKQKGTDLVLHLGIGQHSHLHWPDTTRELLLSVRFDEPGWQWSGSFLPDHIGDTQVKMRNYVSGALNILRVEVQNADVFQDEKIIGDTIGNTGTIFILLSDDDTGFIPYRIDNFSKETLRIYQQKCETLETIVHPYTSCPYAWDEPSYPHRLIVEVPGERILGSYALDDVKRYPPVRLSPSGEKHERTLLSSVHGEGAMKVLSVIDSSCHVTGDKKDPVTSILGEKRKNNEREATFVAHSNISFTISFIGISLIDFHPQELLYAFAKDLRVNLYQNMELEKFSLQISSLQIDNQLQNTPYPVVLSFDEEFKRNTIGHMRSKDGGAQATSEGAAHWASGSSCEPVICLGVSKWRKKDMMLDSLEHVSLRIADLRLELDLELLISLFDFFRATAGLFHSPDVTHTEFKLDSFVQKMGLAYARPSHDADLRASANELLSDIDTSSTAHHTSSPSLPEVVPLGAPWQKIYLLARRQNKIYVEAFRFSPFKITLSFSSDPWMLKRGPLTCGESLIHRGLMALADVEGAQICLREFTITHHIASWESIQEILVKHYSRQFLHELYKVFGSAGVIGNPMGFARRVGLGFKEFLSVPARSVLQSPAGLITGMAQGTTSLLSNTLYAISDTATQFSKAAHKGILAFTFDDQDSAKLDQQRVAAYSQSKGVINELLEGLTGLLQSPIRGAEKHGLPGVLSGFALGVTGLVAKPAASVLEVTGRTAQSIRNRSKLHRMGPHRLRVRLPRPLSWELPLRPYSWDEAIGAAVLMDVDDGMKFKDETLVMCKPLAGAGKFVVLTERLILVVECLSLADLGKPEFKGIAADPEWVIEAEIALESVIHADADEGTVHIVGSSPETLVRQNQQQQRRGGGTGGRRRRWNEPPSLLPLFQTNLELGCKEEAEFFLREVMSTIELGKEQGWGNVHLLHQNNLK